MISLKSLSKYLPYSPNVKLGDDRIITLEPTTIKAILADVNAKLILKPIKDIVLDNSGVGYPDLFEIGQGLGVIKSTDVITKIHTEGDIHLIKVNTGYYSKKHEGYVLRTLSYFSTEGVFRAIDEIGNKIDNGEYSTDNQLKQFRIRPTVRVIDSMYASLLDVDCLVEKGEVTYES